ncbi:MAG: SPFH domain-containing protein [Betaproteobacteria bacterium]|nr:SPFH domain-containing protein [Betaproteobacteria bacterium]
MNSEMKRNRHTPRSTEYGAFYMSGWLALFFYIVIAVITCLFALTAVAGALPLGRMVIVSVIGGLLLFALRGFVILEPNIAVVLTFFGRYAGSFSHAGFSWYNPFCQRQKISLRVYNLNSPTLKVNDKSGNPIEVAAVIAWRVRDTARAVFDVEDYRYFIAVQSESALRQVVSSRCYDGGEDSADSLRGDLDSVAQLLSSTIQAHVELAGIEIIEAKISHLAYAPEIASAMLRRQQAAAVIAARAEIVKGAVTMVQMALQHLEQENIVSLNDADKVQLVTNLMTVLVSENDTQPVLSMSKQNTGERA